MFFKKTESQKRNEEQIRLLKQGEFGRHYNDLIAALAMLKEETSDYTFKESYESLRKCIKELVTAILDVKKEFDQGYTIEFDRQEFNVKQLLRQLNEFEGQPEQRDNCRKRLSEFDKIFASAVTGRKLKDPKATQNYYEFLLLYKLITAPDEFD